MAYDLFPLETIREKAEVLGPVVDGGRTVFVFEHDPKTGAARFRRDGEHFAVAENLES